MISEQKINDWWEHKIENYLQNYVGRNRLTNAQVKERLFTETHDKFVESVTQLLKKLLDKNSGSD